MRQPSQNTELFHFVICKSFEYFRLKNSLKDTWYFSTFLYVNVQFNSVKTNTFSALSYFDPYQGCTTGMSCLLQWVESSARSVLSQCMQVEEIHKWMEQQGRKGNKRMCLPCRQNWLLHILALSVCTVHTLYAGRALITGMWNAGAYCFLFFLFFCLLFWCSMLHSLGYISFFFPKLCHQYDIPFCWQRFNV